MYEDFDPLQDEEGDGRTGFSLSGFLLARKKAHPERNVVEFVLLYAAKEALPMHGIIWWIVVGLIAGWLAGKVMKGGGFGVLMDIVLGIVGAIVGGWVFGLLGMFQGAGLIGSIFVAFVGAVILLWLVRLVKKA